MPTYEYECEKCGNRFERFQQMSDPQIETCPVCRGPVHRLIGAGGGVIFRGGGNRGGGTGSAPGSKTRCGQDHTCCGRDEPCEKPPCGD